jgi:hypothetical protein
MADDFYVQSWAQRMQELEVEKAERISELQKARLQSDWHEAGLCIESIANIDASMQNMVATHQRYEQSQQPPAARPGRGEVDLTPDEAAKICGVDAETYNRGVARLMDLKAKGHYGEGQH